MDPKDSPDRVALRWFLYTMGGLALFAATVFIFIL